MIIKNASIYTENHTFVNGNAVVENGRFVSFSDFSEQDAQIVDAQGLYMIPGLVDIHFHGCMGADMCDGTKEALDIITRYEASIGVTSVCPATMTIAKDELLNVMKNAGDYAYNGGAHLVGINMEGPFISASKKGAQAEENISMIQWWILHRKNREPWNLSRKQRMRWLYPLRIPHRIMILQKKPFSVVLPTQPICTMQCHH